MANNNTLDEGKLWGENRGAYSEQCQSESYKIAQ